jgi:hypothetical protein
MGAEVGGKRLAARFQGKIAGACERFVWPMG